MSESENNNAAPQFTPAEFAQHLVDEIFAHGEREEVTYDAEENVIRSGDGGVLSLSRIYREYCKLDPDDREGFCHNIVRTWFIRYFEMPDDFEDARPDILVAVRSRSYHENLKLHFTLEKMEEAQQQGEELSEASAPALPPYKPFASILGVTPVYDFPTGIRPLSQLEYSQWGMEMEELIEVGVGNLHEQPHPMGYLSSSQAGEDIAGSLEEVFRNAHPEDFADLPPGLYTMVNGDSYSASRLLDIEMVRKLNVQGDPVAMLPTRETLFITGSEDEQMLEVMVVMASNAFDQAERAITGGAFRLNELNEWEYWMPPPHSPSAAAFFSLHAKSLAQDFCEQGAILRDFYKNQERRIAIPDVIAQETPSKVSNVTASITRWEKGAVTLLPRADVVVMDIEKTLVPGVPPLFPVPFSILEEYLERDPGLIDEEKSLMFPTRFWMTRYLNPDLLNEMVDRIKAESDE